MTFGVVPTKIALLTKVGLANFAGKSSAQMNPVSMPFHRKIVEKGFSANVAGKASLVLGHVDPEGVVPQSRLVTRGEVAIGTAERLVPVTPLHVNFQSAPVMRGIGAMRAIKRLLPLIVDMEFG